MSLVDARRAAGDARDATTSASASPTCSRRSKRAPQRVAERIARSPACSASRRASSPTSTLDVAGLRRAGHRPTRLDPGQRRAALNQLVLRRGRWIEPGRRDEVARQRAFARRARPRARRSQFAALINGRRRTPDDRRHRALAGVHLHDRAPASCAGRKRFGMFWMDAARARGRLRHGGRASTTSSLDAAARRVRRLVIARSTALLEPYGGLGAFPVAISSRTGSLENELAQLRDVRRCCRSFPAVAAFLLNVVLSGLIALQRARSAALKALGYGNARSRGTT